MDFSAKLISRGLDAYTSSTGDFQDKEEQKQIAEALRGLNARIQEPRTSITKATAMDQSGRDLLDLCKDCDKVTQKFLRALEKFELHDTKRSKRTNFRNMLESVWSDGDLKKLERRLNTFRQQISMHMLWAMRYVRLLSRIKDQNLTKKTSRNQLESGLHDLASEQTQTREKILDSISESRDWQENIIAAIQVAPRPYAEQDAASSDVQTQFAQFILQQLHFPKLSIREQRIPVAHQATFQWVFQPPSSDQKPWTDFGEWLKSESSLYWITGKPGAGKSTLMKFIGTQQLTTDLLQKPTSRDRPAVARFYSWNSGDKLQKTHEGLLRTLVHEVLQQFADLATKAFPNRWELYRLFGVLDTRPIEYPELQRRFEYAIKSSPSTQFVFFIDDLDEFQGDHADLVDYIRRLSEYSNTKLCVSSRPWNVFEDTFGSTPSLKVEDLTYPDLIRFVETSFTNSQGYAELRAENEAGAEALMHAVASKASGGFLWVGLVVKSLLAGLRDGEKLSRLYDRLDSLPPDLEDLFHKMLSQISDDDRKGASRLFQLVRAAREPLTVITLAWADEDDPKFAVDRAIEPLPAREKDAKSRRMRRRLKGYCRGLLEPGQSSTSQGTVEFLHRTVKDFLYRETVWDEQLSYTPHSFHPNLALCHSYLLQLDGCGAKG